MSSHKKIMKHKKLIGFLIIASLMGILTIAFTQPSPMPPFIPTETGATQTAKIPTINNLTGEQLFITASALENSTEVIAQSGFNETFFNTNVPSGVTNIIYVHISLLYAFGHSLNSSAPHTTSISVWPVAGPALWSYRGISLPPVSEMGPSNDTYGGSIAVIVNGTDNNAVQNCNSAMDQLFNKLQTELSNTWGINIQKMYNTTKDSDYGDPYYGTLFETTLGTLAFSFTNTSAEVYGFMEGLILDNTWSKTIAQKDSPIKTITVIDGLMNFTGTFDAASFMQVGAVIEGQIGKSGDNYTFSTRNLLDITTGNITTQADYGNIMITLPITSDITAYYPSTADTETDPYMRPSVDLWWFSPLSVEDVNVTYTLENDVPYVVAEWGMTNWNMTPGETANLTLTLTNVGTATAYNVKPGLDIDNSSVMYFTDTGGGGSPSKGPFTLTPGANVVIDYNVTANNNGSTSVTMYCDFSRDPSGITVYRSGLGGYEGSPVHVGVDEPLLVYSTDCSDWVVSPGDTVSVYFTVRNMGTQTANDVTVSSIPNLGPVIDSNVTLPEMGEPWIIAETLSPGSSVTANVTSEVDYPTFHTGGVPPQFWGQYFTILASLPLTLPGLRPDTAAHLEFEKYPQQVSVGVNDEVSVSVVVKNLGTETEFVYIKDVVPTEYFEISQGNTEMGTYIDSGHSATLTYKLRAVKSGTVKLPPPTIALNYSFAYSSRNIIDAPLSLPTVEDLTQELLIVFPSALENSVDVYTQAQFNETFFNLNPLSGVTDVIYTTALLVAHSAEQGLNSSAPHTNLFFNLFGGPIPIFPSQIWNETAGMIVVYVNDTGTNAFQNCNSAMEQLFNDLQQRISALWGISIQKLYNTTTVTTLIMGPPIPIEVTIGALMFTTNSTTAEVYSLLEGLIPDNTFAKTIANKNSSSRIITVGDLEIYMPGLPSQFGMLTVGAVIEGQIGKSGDNYTISTRDLLQPIGNITSQAQEVSVISFLLPTTSDIIDFYPPTDYPSPFLGWLGGLPSISYYSEWRTPLNIEDVNVTYTLENGVPYVVVDYDMTNWNMNPGETANLTLTLTNVGTSTAYNVTLYLNIWDDTVMYFTDTGYGWTPNKGPFTLAPGESVVIDYNVTAGSTGSSTIYVDYQFRRVPGGITNYWYYTYLPVHVNVSEPLLLSSSDCSNWLVSPGDTVSVYLTVRNVGTQTAYNVTMGFPSLGPLIYSNVTGPELGQPWVLVDIPAGQAITVNVTSEVDYPSFHTGGAPLYMLQQFGTPSALLPITLPGLRPATATHLEFEKYPELVTVDVNDTIQVSLKVKNLGTEAEFVGIYDFVPSEYFEVSQGSTSIVTWIESGGSITLTYEIKALEAGTFKLPPPIISSNYTITYCTRNVIGTPLNVTTHNTAYVNGTFEIDAVEEAGVQISGNTSAPATLQVWGNETPPGEPEPPAGVEPLAYIRVESDESFNATIVFHYNEEGLPAGVNEEDLAIFKWNETTQVWMELPGIVDTEANTLTVNVTEFSYFMLGAQLDTTPPTVTITSPSEGDILPTSDVTVTWIGDDNIGMDHYEVRIDSGDWVNVGLNTSYTFQDLLDASHTVEVIAFDLAGNNASNVVSFTVDTTPPVVETILSGDMGLEDWYVSPVTVTLTATDDISGVAKTEYSYDGTSWITYTEPFNITDEGITTVYYRSTDNVGNVEEPKTTIIKIDLTPPETTISLEGTLGLEGWYVTDVTVTLSAMDETSGVFITEYSFDGNTWITYIDPFPVMTEGISTLYYRSTDNAGNTEIIKTETIKMDKTPPTTTISLEGTQGLDGRYISDVTVTLTASDDMSGVAETAYSLDGTTWNNYTGPFTITTEGEITIYYNSTDVAGNMEDTKTESFKIDKKIYIRSDGTVDPITAPIVIIDNIYTFTGNIYVPIVVECDNIEIDGNGYTLEGPRTGYYYSGNGFLLSGRSGVTIRNVIIKGWNVGIRLSGSSEISIASSTITDNWIGILLSYSSDNSISENIITRNRHDGIVLDSASGTSISGNTMSANDWSCIYLSHSSGTIISENTIAGTFYGVYLDRSSDNSIFENTIRNNDNGIGITSGSSNNVVYHNNFIANTNQAGPANPAENHWYHPDLLEGNYWSDYPGVDTNYDGIGDTDLPWHNDYYPFVYEYGWLDKTPPITTISLEGILGLDGWFVSNVTVELTAIDHQTDVAITVYSFDGNNWITYTGPFPVSDEGTTTIYYRSTDVAGNVEDTKTESFKIDKTPPETAVILTGTEGLGGWYVSDVTVTLVATDAIPGSGVSETAYSLDGTTWTNYTGPFTITNEGEITIYYNSTDAAGNVEATKTEIIMIDKTPPETAVVLTGTEGLGGWYVSDVTVTLVATDAFSGVAHTYYRIDGGEWTEYSDAFTLGTDGTHTIEYYSVDAAGNNETVKSQIVNVDQTPPTTELIIGTHYVDQEGNIYVTSETEFTLIATDTLSGVAHTYYRVNGGDWVEYDGAFNISGPIGTYTIEYYSVDGAGNNETPKSKTVILEQTFQGYGMLRIGKQWFRGDATLFLSEHLIRVQVEDQMATWNIVKHCKIWNIELIFGEGELGKIVLTIHRGKTTTHILAAGRGVFFCGYI